MILHEEIKNNFHHKDEMYPLKLIKHETEKMGIDFVANYGIRNFLYNGDVFGITTNREWNVLAKTPKIIDYAKCHFFNELKLVAKSGQRYVVRSKDLSSNLFLDSLVDAEICNGIGMYTKNTTGILGYFFNAKQNDKGAINFFVNHLHLIKKIIELVEEVVPIDWTR